MRWGSLKCLEKGGHFRISAYDSNLSGAGQHCHSLFSLGWPTRWWPCLKGCLWEERPCSISLSPTLPMLDFRFFEIRSSDYPCCPWACLPCFSLRSRNTTGQRDCTLGLQHYHTWSTKTPNNSLWTLVSQIPSAILDKLCSRPSFFQTGDHRHTCNYTFNTT